jgi:hypothetical protein
MGYKIQGTHCNLMMNKNGMLALLAVLPGLITSTPSPVSGISRRVHVHRDFPGCLLFAGVYPALRQHHFVKDAVPIIKRSTAPARTATYQFNQNFLKDLSFPSMFGKDREEKRNFLEISKSSDDEHDEKLAVESDCDWEYRDCDTRVVSLISFPPL